MTDQFKSWFKENHALAIFLIGQAIALAVAVVSLAAYIAKMETRVGIVETRGAAFTIEKIGQIESRITVLEQKAENHGRSIDRIVNAVIGDQKFKLQSDDTPLPQGK